MLMAPMPPGPTQPGTAQSSARLRSKKLSDDQIKELAKVANPPPKVPHQSPPDYISEEFAEHCGLAAQALTTPPDRPLRRRLLATKAHAVTLTVDLAGLLQGDEDLVYLFEPSFRPADVQRLHSGIYKVIEAISWALDNGRAKERKRGDRSKTPRMLGLYHLARAWMVARGTPEFPAQAAGSIATNAAARLLASLRARSRCLTSRRTLSGGHGRTICCSFNDLE